MSGAATAARSGAANTPGLPRDSRHGERGSALVIAILITVVLTMLGIGFMLVGETENRIALYEQRSAQALYVAEAGARVVKAWFDHPATASFLPATGDVDRSLREMISPIDPYNPAAVLAPGSPGWVDYKQTTGALFDRPYRGSDEDTLLGTEAGPDLRIDDGDPAGAAFLDALSVSLWGNFPEQRDLRARLSSIEVFAPPYIQVGANWTRFGLATVKVVARLYNDRSGTPEVVAEREIRTVLSEAPYYGPYGPLHSCGDVTLTGPLRVYWGAITAERNLQLSAIATDLPRSVPRGLPAAPRDDPPWTVNVTDYGNFAALVDGGTVPDPWLRALAGGVIVAPPVGGQPQPLAVTPPVDFDQSNLIQTLPVVGCPEYDYDVWKAFATSGDREVHYYTWDSGSSFRENGRGAAQTFEEITSDAEGVYFFDTRDSLPPVDNDGNGVFDNLTPPIVVSPGSYFFRGAVYLNAESVEFGDHAGQATPLEPPGEPFLDVNQDGVHDPTEPWFNLAYDWSMVADQTDTWGGSVTRNARGPVLNGKSPNMHGVLYTNGFFEASGSPVFYGSVVTRQGVTQRVADGSAQTPRIYWDESVASAFPPNGWQLPRTMVTAWRNAR